MNSVNDEQSAVRAGKRARFDPQQLKHPQSQKKSKDTLIAITAVGLLIGLTVAVGIALTAAGRAAVPAAANAAQGDVPAAAEVSAATLGHDPYPRVEAVDGAVRLPLSTFDDYRAHFYTYVHEGQPIEFFVLKSRDGVVRAAFNACDACYPFRRGYYQDGDEMVCGNCGNRFPAGQINEVRGGCNPAPLDRAVAGDALVIQAADVVSGLSYFGE